MHPTVRAAAEWSWRLLIIAAAGFVLLRLFTEFEEVLVPVALAILGSAMLVPVVDALDRRGVPRSLAVLGVIVVALGILAAVLLRGLMIGLGAALVHQAAWVLSIFAAFLIFADCSMLDFTGPLSAFDAAAAEMMAIAGMEASVVISAVSRARIWPRR